jgi:hypothetical protein
VGATVTGLDAAGVLRLPDVGTVAIGPTWLATVSIRGVLIGGGRMNCSIAGDRQGHVLWHAGHALPVFVNGQRIDDHHRLDHGDVINPSAEEDRPLELVYEVADTL